MSEPNIETLLFVDDEESILDIARDYFESLGYRVITAGDGYEATKVLESEKIDCCFTDINMPGMDGIQLAEYIRNTDNTIPVIIMTGFPSLENTIQTIKNGVVDFLVKPVKLGQMELCLKRVLRERRLFIENILLAKELEGKKRLERLNRELMEKVDDLATLNTILSAFKDHGKSLDLFPKVVDMAMRISRADEIRFFLINDAVPEPFQVACVKSENLRKVSEDVPEMHPELIPLIREVASDKKPLIIPVLHGIGFPKSMQSLMIVPIIMRENTFGIMMATKRSGGKPFSEKDLYFLSFIMDNAAFNFENAALYEHIYENLFSTLYAFVKTIEAKDPYTKEHSNRVTRYAKVIGTEMALSKEELDVLDVAGRLHDIGKIGIRDNILLKPGRLTQREFRIIMDHPDIGADIVGQLGFWEREQEIIRCHHERFNGSGYPGGLAGKEIPKLARILSVADVFDAMASDRVYRKKMSMEKICNVIRTGAGSLFDPDVVEVFWDLFQKQAFQE